MIRAKNITKSYGTVKVLKGVDVHISEGEIVSIVGKSGAGKTTLLHILGTLDSPDLGEVLIDGTNVIEMNKNNISSFRNENIGFIFQFHHLLPEFDAIDNVAMPAFIKKENTGKSRKKAEELLKYLGLGHRLSNKPSQLSGGEQQRVAVARALMNDPKVIFADEPTGNLDTKTSDDLHELFFKLRTDFKQTFVIVTHNTELAAMSDRTLTMVDGVISSTT